MIGWLSSSCWADCSAEYHSNTFSILRNHPVEGGRLQRPTANHCGLLAVDRPSPLLSLCQFVKLSKAANVDRRPFPISLSRSPTRKTSPRGWRTSRQSLYGPYREEMSQDPLLRYFYKLRSKILKEGEIPTQTTVGIHNLSLPQDAQRFGTPPPGARGFFVGDQAGGIGWKIELPDGSIEKYYIEPPPDMVTVALRPSEPAFIFSQMSLPGVHVSTSVRT